MREKLLVLCDAESAFEGEAYVVRDREEAAGALDRREVRAICLDRDRVDAALADARWLRRRRNALPVLAVVCPGEIRRAVELLAVGVQEIVARDEQPVETVQRRLAWIERRARSAQPAELTSERIITRSAPMRRCIDLVAKAQHSDATVLIQGETGTGKEVVARLIHEGGARGKRSFVAINCGAFPDTLLESELFGYARGAFTGADRTKAGLFEAAHGGTLFLDEIGETSLAFQVKLLRVLQEGVVRPLGASREIGIDVRIIAATNRDLQAEVELGRFRRDLFYRLNVFPIDVPPLRARPEDVGPLAEHFLGRSLGSLRPRIAADAARLLEAYGWPGNVRELENEIARVLAHGAPEGEITARMLSPRIQGIAPMLPSEVGAETLGVMMSRAERWILIRALERHAGRRIATARTLGITRECLYKKLKRHGLQ